MVSRNISNAPYFITFSVNFRYDLAVLLLKLRQYDKAEKVLRNALESESTGTLCNIGDLALVRSYKLYDSSNWKLLTKFLYYMLTLIF